MKKRIIALSVAAALGGFAGAASAQDADYFAFNPEGVGHIAIVPYFSTQSSNVTLLNITNTDLENGKAVKIRFRGASNSDDIYDFQVFLSPGDMWTAEIRRSATGESELQTTDKSCTLPSNVNGKFITSRLSQQITADARAGETREGYIEILNMADIADLGGLYTDLYDTVKHVSGVPDCASGVLQDLTMEDASDYMTYPTTGLMANWTIINVQRVLAYSGEAASIEARDIVTEDSAAGNIVYWDQRNIALVSPQNNDNTADPLLRGASPAVAGARYDLPDLSTPYLTGLPAGGTGPYAQAFQLSNAMATSAAAGEFFNLSSVGAATDWVISFPTRRYFAAVKYGTTNTVLRTADTDGNVYFRAANTSLNTASGKTHQLCAQLGTGAINFFDREEEPTIPDDIVISPGTPTQFTLCGEVSVVGINAGATDTTATFADVARTNVTNPFTEGWGYFKTPLTSGDVTVAFGQPIGGVNYDATYTDWQFGLPFIGTEFRRLANTTTNVFYGVSTPMRVMPGGRTEFRLMPTY